MGGAALSGPEILRRWTVPLGVGMIGSSLFGAVTVFASVAWLIPIPVVADTAHVVHVNLIALGCYLLFAVPAGMAWGLYKLHPIARWLREDRAATTDEQRRVLRMPLSMATVQLTLWLLGGVVFVSLNLQYSARLTMVIAIAAVLGALATSTFAYFVAERVGRDSVRLALASGIPETPEVPGVTFRILLAWALPTGIPVLSLTLIGGGILLGILPPDVDQLASATLFLGVIALFVGVQAMLLATRSVADPVVSVRKALDRVGDGDLDVQVEVYDGSEVGLLQAGFNEMVAGLRERERLHDIFGRHVGEDVARQALEQGVSLGGEVRHVAVLFIDLVGSTNLAATRPPEEVVALLNEFFGIVVGTVGEHGGSVNKFEGDAALCIFGAPDQLDDHSAAALAAARELSANLAAALPDLAAGIGVSAGEAVAGNIGSAERFEYTVIGDPVNEAARLTELAKAKPGGLLASKTAIDAAGWDEGRRWEVIESIQLRGRTQRTQVAAPKS